MAQIDKSYHAPTREASLRSSVAFHEVCAQRRLLLVFFKFLINVSTRLFFPNRYVGLVLTPIRTVLTSIPNKRTVSVSKKIRIQCIDTSIRDQRVLTISVSCVMISQLQSMHEEYWTSALRWQRPGSSLPQGTSPQAAWSPRFCPWRTEMKKYRSLVKGWWMCIKLIKMISKQID